MVKTRVLACARQHALISSFYHPIFIKEKQEFFAEQMFSGMQFDYQPRRAVRCAMRWCLGLWILLGLAACDGAGADESSRLRVVNASASDAVEIYENLDVLTSLDADEASPYLNVEAGTTLLEARAEEGGAATRQVLLAADSAYTAVVAGLPNTLALLFMTDRQTTPSGGLASVRLLHAAAQTGVVDAEVVPDADDGNAAEVDDLAFTELSPYARLEPGSYTLFIDEVGGSGDTAPRIDLLPGRRYLLVVTDASGADRLGVLVAEQ
jgi:hypothetical protein